VLYRKTEEHHPSLELFEDKDAFIKHKQNKGKTDVKKIELQNVKYIRSSAQKSGKATEYQIELKCRNQKHFLMFSHESDSADWFTKLNGTVDISEHGDNSSSTGLRDSDEEDNDTEDGKLATCIKKCAYISTVSSLRLYVFMNYNLL